MLVRASKSRIAEVSKALFMVLAAVGERTGIGVAGSHGVLSTLVSKWPFNVGLSNWEKPLRFCVKPSRI